MMVVSAGGARRYRTEVYNLRGRRQRGTHTFDSCYAISLIQLVNYDEFLTATDWLLTI